MKQFLEFNSDYVFKFIFANASDLISNLCHALNFNSLCCELHHKLIKLKTELPNPTANFDTFKQWWKENGANWTQELRAIMIEHRNIGHEWQFTNSQEELLKKYYGANKLLVECLNSDCYVSRDVRKQIEDTLLLPIESIKQDNQPPAQE